MVSIGFYHKQFFFLASLLLLLGGIGWLVKNQTSFASGKPLVFASGTDQAVADMQLEDHGVALVNGIPVGGVVSFFREYDEFTYLLVDQPETDVSLLTTTLHFPRPVDRVHTQASAIIVHNYGTESNATWMDDQTLVYQIPNIGPEATVTLVVKLPKGTILPSLPQKLFGSIRNFPQLVWIFMGIALPLITLSILLIIIRARLREEWSLGISERPTPPENLAPAVVAALVDGHVSARAIAATLLDLARRQYLEIASHDGSYTFTKRRNLLSGDVPNQLATFEQALIDKVFTDAPQATEADMRVRIGNNLFSKKVAEVYLDIYEIVTKLGFFVSNPSQIQGSYRLAGLGLFFAGLVGFAFGVRFFADPPTLLLIWVGMILSSLVVIALANRMPAHTMAGLKKRRDWLAFRNYLKSDKPIDYEGQTQDHFFVYLPYAVALGVEVEWAKRFSRSPFRPPEWYATPGTMARLEDFANDLFPVVGYLSRELAAVKEPTLS